MAWAFQKDSELVGMFNHHIHKMKMTGNIDRLWQVIDRKQKMNKDTRNMKREHQALGYENVFFPFLVLLNGLCVAFLQVSLEVVPFCKKNSEDVNLNIHEESTNEAKEIIKELYGLLQEKHSILIKTQMLSKLDKAREKIIQS